ncbi:MAG: methyltransferase domain-containing protein, partial [Luminiphilus sp.]|nr:methyltransferase domain-containing protein [Luminiphilus sp.]
VRPADVAEAILSLLRLNALLKELLLNTPIDPNIKEVDRALEVLAEVPLLRQLMRVCPLPDLEFEAVFVSIRRVLLKNLERIERCPETIDFLSTLSLHCFTNEFVYPETGEELELVSDLETTIAECIALASQPAITEVLCLATYRPLHQYDWSEKLQVLQQLPEVQSRLLEEPRVEKAIALEIPVLAEIGDEVSCKVRDQYENNPYPRWVKLRIPPKAKSVAEVCIEGSLKLHSEVIKRASSPSVLIAGCGTGQHSIQTASRFINSQVIAVDLSRASLAYARRKTSELDVDNVAYLQADILHLEELGQQFDIVESSGVLHHMDDPMAGWRVLTNLLKSGGLMKIGLYSESARRHIVMIRQEIAERGIGTSVAEMRQFRQSVIKSHDGHHQRLKTSGDFYSLSTLRDAIFHVREHRFTAMKIESCLDELGLKFCGFANHNIGIVAKFKESFGNESDTCDLSLWHQFEDKHPSTFAAMYQFWCQKL